MSRFRNIALGALALGVLALSIPSQAEAQWRGRGPGWGGVAAGVVVGSMIGAAAANAGPRYYYNEPAYVAPQPVYRSGYYGAYAAPVEQDCWMERRWVERRDGSMVRRNVRVCE